MTAIIDYKAGNLTSVKNALAAIGAGSTVTSDPVVIRAADHVIFPGVAIVITVLSLNLIGAGLREVLDPKRSKGAVKA